jgi:phosphatidylglycerol---prolipoprotein diacylglyceryl transferase
MYPHVGPLPAFAVGWILATVLGGGGAVWLLRRAGLARSRASLVLLSLVASVLIGSKLLYVLEAWPGCCAGRADVLATLFSARMRLPGGFALMIAATLSVAGFIGVRPLWLLDTLIPAAGLCIAAIRVGCLLEGCCYGIPTSLAWGIRFPTHSPPYWWQVQQKTIAPDALLTVPVHPLQIYLGLAGALIFVVLHLYQSHKRYDGEVLLLFGALYLWSTWFLELLRAKPHALTQQLVLIAAVSVTTAGAVAELLAWERRRRALARPALAD